MRNDGPSWDLRTQRRFWTKAEALMHGNCLVCCWKWQAGKDHEGYGRFWAKGRNRLAHVIAWEMHYNEFVPAGKELRHKCDNRWCVNPHHVKPAKHATNMKDVAVRERQPKKRLTNQEILTVKSLRSIGWSRKKVASMFEVSEYNIRDIDRGRSGRHVYAKKPARARSRPKKEKA